MKKKAKPGKGGKASKPITKTEPVASFFSFFSPPKVPEVGDDDLEVVPPPPPHHLLGPHLQPTSCCRRADVLSAHYWQQFNLPCIITLFVAVLEAGTTPGGVALFLCRTRIFSLRVIELDPLGGFMRIPLGGKGGEVATATGT